MEYGGSGFDLDRRLEFIGIGHADRNILRSLAPIISASIGPALDVFYDKVRREPETSRHFNSSQHMANAKAHQSKHWEQIASAAFDGQYADRVTAIGRTHARLGLEPRWYVGGYACVMDHMIGPILESRSAEGAAAQAKAVAALVKAAMLDIELSISTYLDALDARRREVEQAAQAKQEQQVAALTALTRELQRLASRDLTACLATDLAPEFAELKSTFNETTDALRETICDVMEVADAIGRDVKEIAVASDDLSHRTEQQAASLEETAASLTEVTTNVKWTADNSERVREMASVANADAASGGEVLKKTVEVMAEIRRSSVEINQIIGVIDEIAFQTNLLALNAGVEAARAGDSGRGFAVIASEVRALAQRSAMAAKEIKALISRSTGQVEQGVKLVAGTETSIGRITRHVAAIVEVISEITRGVKDQSTALDQVSIAVQQMDKITQQNAAMVQETNSATRSLLSQVERLSEMVASFETRGRAERYGERRRMSVMSAA